MKTMLLTLLLTIMNCSFFEPIESFQIQQRLDPEIAAKLLKVKRVYIESFGDDKTSSLLHSMISNSLSQSGRIIVTENKEKADAILKGNALEKTSQELHSLGQGTAVSSASGSVSGSGSRVGNVSSAAVSGAFGAVGAAIQDSSVTTETIDRAAVAVRLVASDGDLIWASTQESKGAKYKGAAADVADKVVKQLLKDIEKLENH
jgi:hypothetical protein